MGDGGLAPLPRLRLLRSLKTMLLSANITKVRSTHIELGIPVIKEKANM